MTTLPSAARSIPRRSLIALCGPAGTGKSTFARMLIERNHLLPTTVVSSDRCRLLLCDEVRSLTNAQWSLLQPETFRLFLTIVGMRMSIGRCTIADGVNLHPELRAGMLASARQHRYPTMLVVFDIPLAVCLAQNEAREADKRIPDHQIRAQREGLDTIMPQLSDEGWDQIVILDEHRRGAMFIIDG